MPRKVAEVVENIIERKKVAAGNNLFKHYIVRT
jgi:hypothetical protein